MTTTKEEITPGMNADILRETMQKCNKANAYDKKTFDGFFNEGIEKRGYTVKAYNSHAKKYF